MQHHQQLELLYSPPERKVKIQRYILTCVGCIYKKTVCVVSRWKHEREKRKKRKKIVISFCCTLVFYVCNRGDLNHLSHSPLDRGIKRGMSEQPEKEKALQITTLLLQLIQSLHTHTYTLIYASVLTLCAKNAH